MPRSRIHVTGVVQGVGFRPFVWRLATSHGLSGWVLNATDGVHVEVQGSREGIAAFERELGEGAPAAADVEGVEATPVPEREGLAAGFRIMASSESDATTTLVSPDIATCPDCLAELFDPEDRRFHYPFINCTGCGPRFTIIRSLPYDRPSTSMARFEMCPACRAEYDDPSDRRFHAQPDACFECGPHITWRTVAAPGETLAGDTLGRSDSIVSAAAELLGEGGIVAVKGLGGFRLACDATDGNAVAELRLRKRRPDKPLAVMVATVADARRLALVDEEEVRQLEGSVRPIVLLRRRDPSPVAPAVAGDLGELGVMLPATPLEHLLLRACGRPLVMTSGNASGRPIETDDGRAWEGLSGIADAFLGNDREILARYDDSVVRVAGGGGMCVRRARGLAPRPLGMPHVDGAASVLACGPEQRSTLALTRGDRAFVSQHVGDVDDADTLRAWHECRRRLEDLFDLRWDAVAVDAHPGYLTSAWGRARARELSLPLVEVQHHHAHVAAVLGERGETGPVLGIAFDGTGAGPDGTVWGGEVLLASDDDYMRLGHLGRWRLPGGAASVRDPRRAARGLLEACDLSGHPGAARMRASMGEEAWRVCGQLAASGTASPLTSSAGRLFDAVAALAGVCSAATYEGQPACELEATLDGTDGGGGYPVVLSRVGATSARDARVCGEVSLPPHRLRRARRHLGRRGRRGRLGALPRDHGAGGPGPGAPWAGGVGRRRRGAVGRRLHESFAPCAYDVPAPR